jgi:hypothetical protein
MDILPNSVPRAHKVVFRGGVPWVAIACANCGADGGLVPEAACDFAFYLCDPCSKKWSPLAGTLDIPDEVFWQKVKEEQLDKFGRELSARETLQREAFRNAENIAGANRTAGAIGSSIGGLAQFFAPSANRILQSAFGVA